MNVKKLFHYKENVECAVYYEEEGIPPPPVTNIDFWFSKRVVKDLSVVRHAVLEEIDDKKYRPLFWLAFSETTRFVSYTRNNEFKLYRMPEDKRKSFNPDVFELYFKNLDKIFKRLCKNIPAPFEKTEVSFS